LGRAWASSVGDWLRGAMAWALLPLVGFSADAQQQRVVPPGPAASQAPKTAPATVAILSSYEGQIVTGIQIAGQPDAKTSDYAHLFAQHAGEPFSVQKVQETIAALKATGKFSEIQLQVDPEAQGVRVLLVLQPAIFFGVFEFPAQIGLHTHASFRYLTSLRRPLTMRMTSLSIGIIY
jgi:hypothetical protein